MYAPANTAIVMATRITIWGQTTSRLWSNVSSVGSTSEADCAWPMLPGRSTRLTVGSRIADAMSVYSVAGEIRRKSDYIPWAKPYSSGDGAGGIDREDQADATIGSSRLTEEEDADP